MGGYRLPAIAVAIAAIIAALAAVSAAGAADGSRVAAAERPDDPTTTGRLIVRLDTPLAINDLPESVEQRRVELAERRTDALADRTPGAAVKVEIPELGTIAVRPRPGATLESLKAELTRDPLVESVKREGVSYARLVPNDPFYNASAPSNQVPGGDTYQWYLRRENFPTGWDFSNGAAAQVAMIDTGIAASHADLSGRIVALVAQSGQGTNDTDSHGTHTSGLACADSNNGYGIASSGFDCGLIVEKASRPPDLTHSTSWFTDADIADSITDATNRGAEVINMSLGGSGSPSAMCPAVDYAYARNVVVVAAADNVATSDQGFPARCVQPTGTAPNINSGKGLTVTAAEYDDSRADFSSSPGSGAGFGTGVSMAAYGDSSVSTAGIYSTVPGGFDFKFGTSMSAPQVAGAAALLKSRNPGLTAAQTILTIKQTARRSGGWTSDLGWGILDASAAASVAAELSPKCKGQRATIVGTPGDDVRVGTPGRDVMLGLEGKDKLSGEGGRDLICGGSGRDKLKGGKGRDKLLGQRGRDRLRGGGARDVCKGGKGDDSASACETEKSI